MTREIVFRGKSVDNSEWIEGSFCMDATEQLYGSCNGADGFIRCFDSETHKMKMFEVDRETVGQFTGLTDRNGVKIFEGDIIRWHDNTELSVGGQIAEVCFGKYRDAESVFDDIYPLGFYIRFSDKNCVTISWLDKFKNYFDIIGNIYDSPELLKGGDEK